MVSSMLLSPPAASAFAQSKRPSGLSARMSPMTFSDLSLFQTASLFINATLKIAALARKRLSRFPAKKLTLSVKPTHSLE